MLLKYVHSLVSYNNYEICDTWILLDEENYIISHPSNKI